MSRSVARSLLTKISPTHEEQSDTKSAGKLSYDERVSPRYVDCVLGSGPAAVACTNELLDAGRAVVMVDPGKRLPPKYQSIQQDFLRLRDRESFIGHIREARRGLPKDMKDKKLPFGSTYVYDQSEHLLPLDVRDAFIFRSLASGGLSAVWGATVMPMTERSFRNWPVTQSEMAPFYRRVSELMDVPVVHDDLEELYPNFGDAQPPPSSEQGIQLMGHLLNHRNNLGQAGIRFGRGRSAIGGRYSINGEGCTACGLCMYGCAYRAIFNAEYVVDSLTARPDFTHHEGWIAEGLDDNVSGAVAHLRHLGSGRQENIECDRLFVACGATTSLRLVAGALKWFGRPFYLSDTQQFSIPAFLSKRCRAGAVPKASALSQIFVEMDRPEICDENIHLQIYGFNPFMVDILRSRWGRLINESILQSLFDRMMVVVGYLPGQLSGSIEVVVRPQSEGLPAASCVGVPNPRTNSSVRSIAKILSAHAQDFGWLTALPLMEVPKIGTSAHLAGCLPMKSATAIGETDVLGRPHGMRRVHVVDSACFSDLPSEHLTYTVMANAARVARQATEGRAA